MNRSDAWLLSLFALAYLMLDAAPAAPALPSGRATALLPARTGGTALARVVPRGTCPRNLTHPVSLRSDGAIWCISCDEAFYPEMTVLASLTGLAAA